MSVDEPALAAHDAPAPDAAPDAAPADAAAADTAVDAAPTHPPVLIIVMGVSGTGKSTLGAALAAALHLPFTDGDDLHPPANIAKMARGDALTDADREPWLALIRATAEAAAAAHAADSDALGRPGLVIACSALKRYYRDILRGVAAPTPPAHPGHSTVLQTYFVFIKGERETMVRRMQARTGHFMKASMLDGQIKTLESPEGEDDVVVVRLEDTTEKQVETAVAGLKALAERAT